MNINRGSDFAIRLLAHLAAEGETTSREASQKIAVPLNHLAKLVQVLSRNGFVSTRKGKGGGLKLARDPGRISLAEVIEAVEGPMTLSDCIFNRKSCRFSGKCKVRKYLGTVRSTIYDMLAAKTIADVV
jgi:Rrf2 family protein